MELLAALFITSVLGRAPISCEWTTVPAVTRAFPSSSSVYVEWTAASTSAYEVTQYELCFESPAATWSSDSRLYDYQLDSSVEHLQAALADDTNWTNRKCSSIGRGRSFTLSSLSPSAVYRLAVRAYAPPCVTSNLSPWRTVTTTGILRSVLETQGTGSNNHLPAYIKLAGKTLLDRDDFRGLYVHAISRFNLRTIFAGKFDTHTDEQAANDMADKLLGFDSSVVVMIVSCDVWEGKVTQALVYALQLFGAKLISEVRSSSHIRQPYTFVGIRGLGLVAGQSVESLRASRGMYLYDPRQEVKIPTARARLVLRKNLYRQFYFVESSSQWQYDRESDYYEGSLRFLIYDIREANTTLQTYYGFVIRANYADVYSKQTVKMTELDKLWAGGPVARFDFKHQLYSPGADVASLPQTPVIRSLLDGGVCPPPYTDRSNPSCSFLSSPPLLLQCAVGITPYDCAYLGREQVEASSDGV